MSPFFDYASLLLGTAFGVFWRFMDYRETQVGIKELGTKENNDFAKSKSGKIGGWAMPIMLGLIALAWVIFFAFDETEHWDRVYAGGLAAMGGMASMIAYFDNKNRHRKIRERIARGEVGIPSAGTNVPGGGIV